MFVSNLCNVRMCLLGIFGQQGPDQPAHAQADLGLGCPLTELLGSEEYEPLHCWLIRIITKLSHSFSQDIFFRVKCYLYMLHVHI